MTDSLLTTPLVEWHRAHQGRMVPFAGWEMPVQYTSIIDEHQAVRKAAGLFDISHMGRLHFRGPLAITLLDRVVTIDITRLKPGQIRYALVTNDAGGVLDDVLVYRDQDGPDAGYWLVVNASNRIKLLEWFAQQGPQAAATIVDHTTTLGMIALQGPRAQAILQPRCSVRLESLKYFQHIPATIAGVAVLLSRTGYTGEDGFEVFVPADATVGLWEALLHAGAGDGLIPAGLGCRDTLRLESAMPLYGHELNEATDPFTAGLNFAVHLNKAEFVGQTALAAIAAQPTPRVRVGLSLESRRIAREETPVYLGDRLVGTVTSGTFSPTLEQSIAMAYVDRDVAGLGTALEVDLRGRREAATIVGLPFYKRA